jgi:MFS family permease
LRRDLTSNLLLLVALVTIAGLASLARGQDANWDLLNYHYYNPWAWWNSRIFDRDIAAAQLQTFHNPVFDLPFFAMVQWDWPPRVVAFALAIPTGVAAFFFAKLLLALFHDLTGQRRTVALLCAFAIGMTSAMGVATLGTTMNEWPVVALVMAALWLIVRSVVSTNTGALPRAVVATAGLLMGIAAGGKLTAATFAVGLLFAIGLRPRASNEWRGAMSESAIFVGGIALGALLVMGAWTYELWTHFQSPVFPYFNDWIQSPWWDPIPVIGRPYGPHTLLGWLTFPFRLWGSDKGFVAEVPYRDLRIPLACALAIAAVLLLRRRSTQFVSSRGVVASWRLIGVFVVVSFVIWTAQHSIYRYIVALDLLAGPIIVYLLYLLVPGRYFAAAALSATVVTLATTRFADWWHVDFRDKWFEVAVPRLEQDALVLITTHDPVAYALPFLPADARHLGVLNTINTPARRNLLQAAVRNAIAEHRGPIYQLTSPADHGTSALAEYGVARVASSCTSIVTNMPTSPIQVCRVRRE